MKKVVQLTGLFCVQHIPVFQPCGVGAQKLVSSAAMFSASLRTAASGRAYTAAAGVYSTCQNAQASTVLAVLCVWGATAGVL